ncbi:hypothetical protein Tco_0639863 [Tanacetum coccineum]
MMRRWRRMRLDMELLDDDCKEGFRISLGFVLRILGLAFGKLLEEIHVTWTQFGKKRDKIATLHEKAQRIAYSAWRRRLNSLRDDVRM